MWAILVYANFNNVIIYITECEIENSQKMSCDMYHACGVICIILLG